MCDYVPCSSKKVNFLFCCGVGFSVVWYVIVGWYSCEVEKASQYRGSDDIKLGASGVSSAKVTNGVTRHIIAFLYCVNECHESSHFVSVLCYNILSILSSSRAPNQISA